MDFPKINFLFGSNYGASFFFFFLYQQILNRQIYRHSLRVPPVADLGGGMGGMHPPHQPKSYDFGRKISPYFE